MEWKLEVFNSTAKSGNNLETFLSGMETAKFTQDTSGMEVSLETFLSGMETSPGGERYPLADAP